MKDELSVAELLGLSDETIRTLSRSGVIAKRGRRFPTIETLRAYVTYIRRAGASRNPDLDLVANTFLSTLPDDADYVTLGVVRLIKWRDMWLQDGLHDWRLWGDIIRGTRAAILDLPRRLASRTGLDSGTLAILEEEARSILDELAPNADRAERDARADGWMPNLTDQTR